MQKMPQVLPVTLLLLAAACGPTPPDDGGSADAGAAADVYPSYALSAAIGPEGGTLTGERGTALEGVTLEIPAGALAETITVTISPTVDESALPEAAQRVGPQFLLEPEGTMLAAPARWTLPVDRALEGLLAGQASELKVWVRDGDGWRLTEPVATTDTSVTIEIQPFTVAAAGIRVTRPAPACGPAGCVALGACTDTAGFCVGAFNDLPFPTFGNAALSLFRPVSLANGSGETIVFAIPGTQRTTVGRLNLPANVAEFSTKAITSTQFFNETGIFSAGIFGSLVRQVAGDANTALLGRFLLPTNGLQPNALTDVVAPLSTSAPATALFTTPSRAAITLKDGRTLILRQAPNGASSFASDAFFLRGTNGTVTGPISMAGPARHIVNIVPDPVLADAFWVVSAITGLTSFETRFDRLNATGNLLLSVPVPQELRTRFIVNHGDAEFAVGPAVLTSSQDALFMLAGGAIGEDVVLRLSLDGAFTTAGGRISGTEGISSIVDLDIDTQGNRWGTAFLTNGSRAVVMLGNGNSITQKVVQIDPALAVSDVFPSATSGVWLQVRPVSGTSRPLGLMQVRPVNR